MLSSFLALDAINFKWEGLRVLLDDIVNIIIAFSDPRGTYARHAAVTLASVFINTNSPVHVFLLHDETLTDENRTKLQETADLHNKEITFIDASGKLDSLAKKMAQRDYEALLGKLGRGTFYRLFAIDLIPVSRAIYLDCDILVTRDIRDLWQEDLDDKALGVVPDYHAQNLRENKGGISSRTEKLWNFLGIEPTTYFNAGVLLMNFEKIRANYNLAEQSIKFFMKYSKIITMADQDFLNFLFHNDKKILPEDFNRIRPFDTSNGVDGQIFHTASHKPYETYTRPLIDELYWHFLRQTAFCKREEELVSAMCQGLGKSYCVHLHSNACLARLMTQMKQNIFEGHYIKSMNLFLATRKEKKATI